MCTAVSFLKKDHYFGRNLDLEYSYDETVTVTPRNYPFRFRSGPALENHYALIGVAHVEEGYPLYYDAANEKGLSMAGLNFPVSTDYKQTAADKDNIAPFEFIPWILGRCANLSEARRLLERVNLTETAFSEKFPLTPLHWMVADRSGSLAVECARDGLRIHENPTHVLTNEPPFRVQMWNLCNYLGLSAQPSVNRFAPEVDLRAISRGMGAMGLPGDLSSQSRFVRAAFVRLNSVCGDSERECVSHFFHILGSVAQQRGCVRTERGKFDITVYSSCCNTDKGIYYYTTYEGSHIHAVDLHRENLDGSDLSVYPMKEEWKPVLQN